MSLRPAWSRRHRPWQPPGYLPSAVAAVARELRAVELDAPARQLVDQVTGRGLVEQVCRCGSTLARHRSTFAGGCLDCPCPGFALTARDELDAYRRTRTPRTLLLDGLTGELRQPRIRLDGPVLRVNRRRDVIHGHLLPGFAWGVWHGCRILDSGVTGPGEYAAALAVGLAALDVELARARA